MHTKFSALGHRGWFHDLPIVNRATANTDVKHLHDPFAELAPSVKILRRDAAVACTSALVLWGTTTLTATGVVCVPSSSVEGFSFSTHPSICYVLLNECHLTGVR